jgi:hypothetical protein
VSEKSTLTKKDAFILLIAVLLGFAVKVAYDIAHELAYQQTASIIVTWFFAQFCYIVIALVIPYLLLKQID